MLKRGALIIFSALFVIGVLVAVMVGIIIPHAIQNKNTSRDLRQLLTGVQRDYGYNDGTILSKAGRRKPAAWARTHMPMPISSKHYWIITALMTGLRRCGSGHFMMSFLIPPKPNYSSCGTKLSRRRLRYLRKSNRRVCYPAGSFLLPAPFVFLGISDIRIVYAIFFLAGLVYAVWIIPKKKRLLFIGVAFISLELWNSIFSGGEMGNLYFPFLLIAWLALNRNLWLSVICMGIAVTTKQTAWFFLPFYLILLFKTHGIKKLLAGMSVIAAIFVVTNLPFALGDLRLWFASITSPMTDLMFPNGMGLITLVASGVVKTQIIFAVHAFGSDCIYRCHSLVFQILPAVSANRADSGNTPALFCLAQHVPLFLLCGYYCAGVYHGE